MKELRFRPPAVEASTELRWVLQRAFGPPGQVVSPGEPQRAEALAGMLDLVPRIAVRLGRRAVTEALGAAAAGRFLAASHAAAGVGLRIEAVVQDLVSLAGRLSLPLVALKFGALHLSGIVAPGSRTCSDLDVLVPGSRARELQRALLAAGARPSDQSDYEHQLAGVVHPSGALVEIHTRILGVRVDGARSADHEALRREGLLRAVPGWPSLLAVPAREVLAAHATVHGIAQHGSVPASYPSFRMLADIVDLSPAADSARWRRWISRDVAPEEVDALLGLARQLSAGRLPIDEETPESILLRHFLTGALDPQYAASLRLGGLFREVTDAGPLRSLARQGWQALFPGGAELDRIYGADSRPGVRLARRILRPFHVAGLAARYAAQALRTGVRPAAK